MAATYDDTKESSSVEMDMIRRRSSPVTSSISSTATDEQLRDAALRDDIPMTTEAPEREEEWVSEYEAEDHERRAVQPKCPRRACMTAFFLLFVGVLFGSLGLGYLLSKGIHDDKTIPFLTIGGIGFIPGAYHVVILVRAWLGHPGWTYDDVPSFAD